MYCLMPPHLSEKGRRTILLDKLYELLSTRWGPAMEQLCTAVGFSDQEIEDLSKRAVTLARVARRPRASSFGGRSPYFVNGPCDAACTKGR